MGLHTRWESLGGGVKIEVSNRHTFGEDALLLAQFTAPRPEERVCDLGTGCGILPLLWSRRMRSPQIEAVEYQADAAAMAARSVAQAGLDGKIRVHSADLRRWRDFLPPASQDVVTMNPPYFAAGTGRISSSPAVRIARHEGEGCTFSDVVDAAGGLLRPGGRLCICHRPERMGDVFHTLQQAELKPRRLRFVHVRPNAPPWLFLCEARLTDGDNRMQSGALCVQAPFFRTDADGNPSLEYRHLYGMY